MFPGNASENTYCIIILLFYIEIVLNKTKSYEKVQQLQNNKCIFTYFIWDLCNEILKNVKKTSQELIGSSNFK